MNHAKGKQANCKVKIISCNGLPALCIFALKQILSNDELLYDYGIKNLPWEMESNSLQKKERIEYSSKNNSLASEKKIVENDDSNYLAENEFAEENCS